MPSTRVHVDFNDIEDDDRIGALTDDADDAGALVPGALVTLWDEDGNTAQGRVAELADRGLVWIDLLRNTWRSHPEERQHAASGYAPLTAFGVVSITGGTAPTTLVAWPLVFSLSGQVLVMGVGPTPGKTQFAYASAHLYKMQSVTGLAPASAEVAA
jgi:hypothetical protein